MGAPGEGRGRGGAEGRGEEGREGKRGGAEWRGGRGGEERRRGGEAEVSGAYHIGKGRALVHVSVAQELLQVCQTVQQSSTVTELTATPLVCTTPLDRTVGP